MFYKIKFIYKNRKFCRLLLLQIIAESFFSLFYPLYIRRCFCLQLHYGAFQPLTTYTTPASVRCSIVHFFKFGYLPSSYIFMRCCLFS